MMASIRALELIFRVCPLATPSGLWPFPPWPPDWGNFSINPEKIKTGHSNEGRASASHLGDSLSPDAALESARCR